MVGIDSRELIAAVGHDQVVELLTVEQYIALVDGAGMPYAEIARKFNMPLGTVKSAMNRARKKLLNAIEVRCGPLRREGDTVRCTKCGFADFAAPARCCIAQRILDNGRERADAEG